MYVRDLEEGCLLKPSEGWTWRVSTIRDIAYNHSQDEGMTELAEAGIHHSVTMVNARSPHGKENPGNPAVYTGKHKTNAYFYGLKTHHLVIVDGMYCTMDGYSFRDVEKV
jgi:hypothetical protein